MIASGQRQLTHKQVDQLESSNDLLIKFFLALRKLALCDVRGNDGDGLRVYRGVLQPEAAALDARFTSRPTLFLQDWQTA